VSFIGLAVSETAKDLAGYAFRAEGGSNVQMIDCDATLAGKHHFGDIDSSGFVGQGLTASVSPPDLGYGGASAFVTFSDNLGGRANNSASWIDCTWSNPNGNYPAFITHGDSGAIGQVLVQNLVSLAGFGTGMIIYPTGPQERV